MESITVLSWNIRGVAKKANRDNLRKLIQHNSPSVVCLQESKKESKGILERKYLGAWDGSCWVEIPPSGQSVGLVTF